jgi:hypothetical protein
MVEPQCFYLPHLQALNVLMLKILENCNRNHSFSALLGLLIKAPEEVPAVPEQELRWADLVVKCLIKITKALPATLEVSPLARLIVNSGRRTTFAMCGKSLSCAISK